MLRWNRVELECADGLARTCHGIEQSSGIELSECMDVAPSHTLMPEAYPNADADGIVARVSDRSGSGQ